MSEKRTISTVSTEAKDLLSRLLASENIEVIHQEVPTAYFDVQRRVLCLPMWKDMSNDLYDMLIGHEVSHALFTPAGSEPLMTAIDSIDSKNKAVVKDYLNVVEDARIERMIQKKFPGLRKNFRVAYREMVERDFFGIAGKDVQSLGLIDRLNIHFKVGTMVGIQFNAEEQVFADRMLAVSTWDEVVDLARDLYEYCKAQSPQTPQPEVPEADGDFDSPAPEGETGTEVGTGMPGDSDDDSDSESEGGDGDEGSESEDGESGSGSESPEAPEDADGDPASAKGGEDSGDSMEDDTDDGESAESTDGDSVQDGSASDNQPNEAGEGEVTAPGSETQRAMDSAMEDMVDENASAPIYGSLPKLNLDSIVVDYSTVIEEFTTHNRGSGMQGKIPGSTVDQMLAKVLKEWEAREGKTVATMAKQFELKKNADISKRASIAKTGVLDTVKMVDYRWSEDIFRKHTLLPKGKNHGVMMFIDWSGSMQDMMSDTIRQLVTLAAFCRRVNIPFEAYAFTNSYGDRYEDVNVANCQPGEFDMNRRSFRLLNLLSSRAKNRDWNRLVACCLQMIDYFDSAYSRNVESEIFSYRGDIPRGYGLGSTPLDESIVAAAQMVPDFQAANGLQIVNTFFLTDGGTSSSPLHNDVIGRDSDDGGYWGRPVVLKKGTRQWKSEGRNTTQTLLRYLSDTTGSKVMGMFLQTSRYFHHADEKKTQEFTENKCVELGAENGYDNYFLLDPTSRKGKRVADLDADASPTVVRNAFIREAKQGKAMRNLMSRIAECVAIDRF